MGWSEAVTLAIAVLGAALGVINTWNSINTRKVRLRVRPSWTIGLGGHDFGIEVMNLSAFPVTLDEVGFLYGRSLSSTPRRAMVMRPTVIDGGPWPRRLDARGSVFVYFASGELPGGRPFWRAYGKTACGVLATGSSPAFRQLREMVRKNPPGISL